MKDKPPLEHRLTFVQYVRRQRCRYNQSFSHFMDLPSEIRGAVVDKWRKSHPRLKLPKFEVSRRPERKKKSG